MKLEDQTAFPFTEARVEEAIRLVQTGKVATKKDGRRKWRDSGSRHGLIVIVGAKSATYYRLTKERGRKVYTRIGDATAMRVTKAREIALQRAGGNPDAAPQPMRVRTDGVTVEQAWNKYMADAKSGAWYPGRKPTSAATIKSYEELWRPHLQKQFGRKTLHALAKAIPQLHRKMSDRPATANRLLQVVRNLFGHARHAGDWSGADPTIDTQTGKSVIKRYSIASRARYLLSHEAARLLEHAAGECEPWNDFWKLLVLTGVRVSTLREMRWKHLDLRDDGNAIWAIPTTKNGDPHIVPLEPAAVQTLRARLGRAPKAEVVGDAKKRHSPEPESEWVFPMKRDSSRCIADVDHAIQRARVAIGLVEGADRIRIHDLRRTAGSWSTQHGVPMPSVGKLLGHRSQNSTAVYARSDVAGARQAARVVADILTACEPKGENE
jgi:integrase